MLHCSLTLSVSTILSSKLNTEDHLMPDCSLTLSVSIILSGKLNTADQDARLLSDPECQHNTQWQAKRRGP